MSEMARRPMRSELIVFFDVETAAAPSQSSGRWWLLEFGAILVCPRKLVEVESYHTLIRPGDLTAVSRRFTADADMESAPEFKDVADEIFEVLDGRVWAGHNIQRFDCPRIREAFAGVGRPAPEPAGVIDSLNVLAADFGRRAGDLKMATLAAYFGIGKQKHRSLDDARMNLEVLKHCATVLLLESTLPDLLGAEHQARQGAAVTVTTRRMAAHHRRATTTGTTGGGGVVLSQTKLPFTPVRVRHHQDAAAPAPPPPTPATPACGGKRNSLGGKVVPSPSPSPRAAVAQAQQPAAPAPLTATTATTTTTTGSRRPVAVTTTPFHMILRHSRAILR